MSKKEREVIDKLTAETSEYQQDSSAPMGDIIDITDMISFGKSKKCFNVSILRKYIKEDKIEKAKEYIHKYFIRLTNPIGTIYYFPSDEYHINKDNSIGNYKIIEKKKDVMDNFIEKDLVYKYYDKKEQKVKTMKLQDWFFSSENNERYIQVFSINHPKFFKSKITGSKYINMFEGFMWRGKEIKSYESFSDEAKEGVRKMWNHLKILVNNDTVYYRFVKQWIARMVAGKRNCRSALYFKSKQGTGKSTFLEFIAYKVIGEKLVTFSASPELVFGDKNGMIYGKVMVVNEELPTENKGKWLEYAGKMKYFITADRIPIRLLFKEAFSTKNVSNFILTENHDSLKIDNDDRRFVVLDINPCKIGDTAYFTELYKYINNPEVGEAFYWYCIEYEQKHPNEIDPKTLPLSKNKRDMINDNLMKHLEFIKEKYILKRKDIDETFKSFYTKYCEFCEKKNKYKSPMGRNKFRTELIESFSKRDESGNIVNPCVRKGGKNKVVVKIKMKDILAYYQKNNFLSNVDEFENIASDDDDDDDESEEEEKPIKQTVKKNTTFIEKKKNKKHSEEEEVVVESGWNPDSRKSNDMPPPV